MKEHTEMKKVFAWRFNESESLNIILSESSYRIFPSVQLQYIPVTELPWWSKAFFQITSVEVLPDDAKFALSSF